MEGHVLAGDVWPPPAPGPDAAPRIVSAAATLVVESASPLQFVDITASLRAFVGAIRLRTGWVNVQTLHTTTGLLVNEHESLLLEDLTALFERLAPRDAGYAHDELHRRTDVPPDERPNGHAHARAALLRTSECLNVVEGSLFLGRWQRVLLVELDGPRSREVSLVALGTRG